MNHASPEMKRFDFYLPEWCFIESPNTKHFLIQKMCNLNISGSMPYVKDGKKSLKFEERVDMAVCWLKNHKNLTFEALYFEEPDKTTHAYGADSNKSKVKGLFKTALSKVDQMLGRLISKLNESNLLKETNIIVIGMRFKD